MADTEKNAVQPTSARNTAKKPDSTRDRILDAAEKLFAENSYEGTTLREIAKGVGIREPSLYAHFANKDAIYGAVIDRALLPFSDEMQLWDAANLTLADIHGIPRKLMELHARHPYSAQILHQEFSNPPQRISSKVLQWQKRFVEQSQTFMAGLPEQQKQGLNATRVVANMVTLTNIILGYFSAQGMQQSLLDEEYDAEEAFEEQVRLATKIFKSLLV